MQVLQLAGGDQQGWTAGAEEFTSGCAVWGFCCCCAGSCALDPTDSPSALTDVTQKHSQMWHREQQVKLVGRSSSKALSWSELKGQCRYILQIICGMCPLTRQHLWNAFCLCSGPASGSLWSTAWKNLTKPTQCILSAVSQKNSWFLWNAAIPQVSLSTLR